MYGTLLLEKRKKVMIVTINRPERMNALGDEVRKDLLQAFKDFNADEDARVLVLAGQGKAFSAGAGISSTGNGNRVDIEKELSDSFHLILKEIRHSKKIFISAITGVAAGAGISLALACDLVFASRNSRFVMAFQGIGLAPDTGLTMILLRLAGGKVLPYLLQGGEFSAQEAENLGLVRIVEDPLNEAIITAAKLADGPFRAYAVSKMLINQALYYDLDYFLQEEARLQGELSESHDFNEGIKAFREKRKPEFNGT